MKLLVRAVVTGFGLAVGAAIYKKLAQRFGLDDEAKASAGTAPSPTRDGAIDPVSSE